MQNIAKPKTATIDPIISFKNAALARISQFTKAAHEVVEMIDYRESATNDEYPEISKPAGLYDPEY